MIFEAKKYRMRQDLEMDIGSQVGLTADTKNEHTIEGTVKELKKLHLRHGARVWGIRCVDTGYIDSRDTIKTKKVNRGTIQKPAKRPSVDFDKYKEK